MKWTPERGAVLLWIVGVVAVSIAISLPRKQGKLYPTFAQAGSNFLSGTPLYGDIPEGHDQFRYSPIVAAAFSPWAFLPVTLGGILWRLLQAVALLFAIRAWASVVNVSWGWLALLSFPLIAGNLHNGQLNPLVLALMLAGAVAFERGRYSLSALAIAGATAFKIYPLALGLLLVVVEPKRFGGRLLLATMLMVSLPFAMQSSDYVRQQYEEWSTRLEGDDRSDLPMEKGYFDFQKLMRRWGVPISLGDYRKLEVVAGGLLALLLAGGYYRSGQQPSSRLQSINFALAASLLWCTLFGPASEESTYLLLAVPLSQAALEVVGRARWERCMVWSSYLLLLSMPISLWFPLAWTSPYRALIPQAHGALLFGVWLTLDYMRGLAKDRSQTKPG
jgi:hypothetical protein